MKEHIKVTYEAFDGKMFNDQTECLDYELNELYKRSGIRFLYEDGSVAKTLDEHSYNMADFIDIDRSKEKENKAFVDCVYDQFGWVLLREIYNDDHKKYRLDITKAVPI